MADKLITEVFDKTVEAALDDQSGGQKCTGPFMEFLMNAMQGSIPSHLTMAQAKEWAKTARYRFTIHAEFTLLGSE